MYCVIDYVYVYLLKKEIKKEIKLINCFNSMYNLV